MIDYKALAAEVREMRLGHKVFGGTLEILETLLEGMAEAEPFAWAVRDTNPLFPEPGPWNIFYQTDEPYIAWTHHEKMPLYLHPAPQPQPNPAMLELHRRWVEQAVHDAEHPSGMSTHDGKARIDASVLRRMLAIIDAPQPRRPYGTDTMSEMGIVPMCDEPRPCTCHPDDNPPVPCARQYALNECRAASEPTEAQIEEYEILCNGEWVAGANGPGARAEILHYLTQYEQDGPCEVYAVTRRLVDRAALAARE